ncbi:DNA polymerase III subunit delta' [Corynebacterium halotolerans]|uniref:DNA polymerase III subunit delta' n=1 Tax=Corynebacterium halotolerans TaxID=225326 RepID=UPI003CEB0AFD
MSAPSRPESVSERLADLPAVRKSLIDAAFAARARVRGVPAREYGVEDSAMTHSWLFTGPPGSGRSNAAVALAAALVCTDPEEPGCGRCEDCRAVFNDSHTDVVHIVPQELTISVKSMEQLIRDAASMPTVSPWRVVVLEDADRLSDGAANSLLKTVEEPPPHTIIVLCAPSTDPEDFSVTLRSRCRHVYVKTPSRDEITRILVEEENASETDAQLAASASLRHIGRARKLVNSREAQKRRTEILNLAELVFHGDQAFQAVSKFVDPVKKQAKEALSEINDTELKKLEASLGAGGKGKGTQKLARGLKGQVKDLEKQQKLRETRQVRDILDLSLLDFSSLYRDALMLSVGADVELTHPDYRGLAADLAEKIPEAGLVQCLDAIAHCREQLGQNVPPKVAFDGMVGRIRKAAKAS